MITTRFTDDAYVRAQALRALHKVKEKEKSLRLHQKRINDRVIVSCLRKERLEEFEKLFK